MTIAPNFKTVNSDRLFYDRWNYCVKFFLREVSAVRGLPEQDRIVEILQERQHWRQQVRHRWPQLNTIVGDDSVDPVQINSVLNFANFLRAQTVDYKIVISVSMAWIYTNDLDLIQQLADLPYIQNIQFSQVEISRPRDCVMLKNPQHTWRSYFRSRKFTSNEKQNLWEFLQNQQDVRVSEALMSWLNHHYSRCQDYYFIDHHGQGFETMLSLIVPNLIRRTLPIVAKY